MPIMPTRQAALLAALLLLLAAASGAQAAKIDQIATARRAYNTGDYDGAVEAAQAAIDDPKGAAEARIVLGRALVERFRRSAQPDDLIAARSAFVAAGSVSLSPPLRIEWLIGSAETLFFEEQYGAAAAMLASILEDPRAELAVPGGRDRLVDWWASALDRSVQMRDLDSRRDQYSELSRRLARELERDPALGSAAYWQVVAARGAGNLDGAWDVAHAAWVRAPLALDRGAALRADLDRIVTQALIPERARRTGRDQEKQVAAAMRDAWEDFKQRWAGR